MNPLERMRLARREMSPAAGRLRAFPAFLAGVRATRFTQKVLGRYTGLARPSLPAGLVYPASSPRLILKQVTYRRPVSLSLRLSLTLLNWPGMPVPARQVASVGGRSANQLPSAGASGQGATGSSGLLALPPQRPPKVLLRPAAVKVPVRLGDESNQIAAVLRTKGQGGNDTPAPQVFAVPDITRAAQAQGRIVLAASPQVGQLLTRRAERIPMVTGPMDHNSSGALRPDTASLAAPVPRVVRRPPSLQDSAPQAASSADGRSRTGSPRPTLWPVEPSGGNSLPLEPFQLNRLADQVVRVIDDRIVARHERTGRV